MNEDRVNKIAGSIIARAPQVYEEAEISDFRELQKEEKELRQFVKGLAELEARLYDAHKMVQKAARMGGFTFSGETLFEGIYELQERLQMLTISLETRGRLFKMSSTTSKKK